MKNIIIHVGLPKAGSTYLQKQVFPKLENVYFLGRRPNNFLSNTLDYLSWKNPFTLDLGRVSNQVDEFVENLDEDFVLLSREAFFGNFYTSFVANHTTACALKEVFPRAKIIIVLRRQDRLIESAYKQALHQGHSITLARFIGLNRKGEIDVSHVPLQEASPVLDVSQLNWLRLVEKYYEIFGVENVCVLTHEQLRENSAGFLGSFYYFTGINEFYPDSDSSMKNRGYSLPSRWIALLFNRVLVRRWNPSGFVPEKPFYAFFQNRNLNLLANGSRALQLRAFLQKGLDKLIYLDRPVLSASLRNRILNMHHASNAELDQKYLLDLKRWGYYRE